MDAAAVGKTMRLLFKRVVNVNSSVLGGLPFVRKVGLKGLSDAFARENFRQFGITASGMSVSAFEGREFLMQWQVSAIQMPFIG